jgi:hypothetical protein
MATADARCCKSTPPLLQRADYGASVGEQRCYNGGKRDGATCVAGGVTGHPRQRRWVWVLQQVGNGAAIGEQQCYRGAI